jgi:hypothetical protein
MIHERQTCGFPFMGYPFPFWDGSSQAQLGFAMFFITDQ